MTAQSKLPKIVTIAMMGMCMLVCALLPSEAAITVNFSTNTYVSTASTTHTNSGVVVADGSDRKLVYVVNSESAFSVTAVTYGAQSFIKAVDNGNTKVSEIWYLDNPAVGTANVVAQWDGADTSRSGVLSLTGAASGAPTVSNTTNFPDDAEIQRSIDLTTVADNTFVVGTCVQNNGVGTPVKPVAWSAFYSGDGGSCDCGAGYATEATPGLKTYTWTIVQEDGSIAVAGFSPAPDTIQPAIASGGLSPADNAINSYVGTDLVATFDENIALTGSGTIIVTNLDDNTGLTIDLSSLPDPNGTVTVLNDTLTIDLTTDLGVGSNYAVRISGDAIVDLATPTPNAFAGILDNTTWNFTTAAITYHPITGDADSGISSTKTYTHAIDFGTQPSGGGVATINGVVFADGGPGAFPAIGGSSQTVGTGSTTIPTDHQGDANANITGGMEDLVHDLVYNDATAVITLTGLTPGQPYRFRLYNRQYGTTAATRGQNIGFDTDGVGTDITGAEHTATFKADDATKPDPSQATFNQVYALTYDYTLSAGVTTLTVYINATSSPNQTYHLYGLTNEEAGPDTTAPTVSTLDPDNEETGVYIGVNLVASFDEDIALTGSGTITITDLDDNSSTVAINLPAPGQVSVSGPDLTIKPTANLESLTHYSVRISADAIEDLAATPNAFAGIANDTTWDFTTAAPDFVDPELNSGDIVDNRSGGPVNAQTLVTYTVSFSEDMDGSSVSSTDFGNAGNATITIGTVTETSPGVFSVPVRPTQGGTLQLKINAGAALTDVAGNPLNTSAAIADNTTLIVSPAIAVVNTAAFWSNSNLSSYTKSFNAGAADKLILSAHHESAKNITSITYNSVPLTMISGSFADKRANGIWYLDDPHAGGAADIVVTLDGAGTEMGLGIVSVVGTADGHQDVSTASTNSVDLAVSANSSLVFVAFGVNQATSVTAQNPLSRLTISGYDSMAADAGYVTLVNNGTHTYSCTAVGSPLTYYAVAASFKPSSAFKEGSVFRFR